MGDKKAKLFQNGRSQAVRLPAEFRFEGKEVYVRRNDATGEVILSPVPSTWDGFFEKRDASLEEARDFLVDRRDPPLDTRTVFDTPARVARPRRRTR